MQEVKNRTLFNYTFLYRDIHMCMSPHQTVTMATKGMISPLLRPRPEFLGVGCSRGRELNLFEELLKLSVIGIAASNEGSKHETILQPIHDPSSCCDVSDAQDEMETAYSKDQEVTIPVLDYLPDGQTRILTYKMNKESMKLFETLDSLNIDYTTEVYKPKDQRMNVNPNVLYCKNLLLKDRKGVFYLVIVHEDIQMDLKNLRKAVKAYRNFNFCNEEEMAAILGVEPGAVTPLALMMEMARDVRMVISNSLLIEGASVMFHPLDARLATQMTIDDFMRFLEYFNHPVTFVD